MEKKTSNWIKTFLINICKVILCFVAMIFMNAVGQVCGSLLALKNLEFLSILAYFLAIGIILFIFKKQIKEETAIFKKNWKKYVLWAIGITIFLIIFNIFYNKLRLLVYGTITTENNSGIIELINDYKNNPFSLVSILLVITIVGGPIFEETVYRFLPKGILKNNLLFLIISSFYFAAIHVSKETYYPLDWIAYLIPGITYAIAYIKTKNIYTSMIAHSLNNVIGVLLIILELYK